MKKMILPVILMLLAGCDYEVPLSQTSTTAADPALAGTWIQKPADGKTVPLEIKISGTDYYATLGENSDAFSFKGFSVSTAGLNLIQLEQQNATTQNKYLFVKFELTPEGLSVYRLNPEVVSAKCRTAEELINDIAVHRQNPSLFTTPIKFVR